MKKRKPWVVFYFLTIAAVLLAAQWGSRAVTVMTESSPLKREHCIVIDPGHGGEDGGATSCAGIVESTYNLEISLRLNDLMHLLGYSTRMTRTTDTSIYTKGGSLAQKKVSDLKERVRIANETEEALLVSIHQNIYADSQYSGAQVFYASTEGSEVLAKALQDAFRESVNPGSNRRSKQCTGVYLMEHIQCTGVLIECGFLSNPGEEAKLRSADYQKRLCCVIAATVSAYLGDA